MIPHWQPKFFILGLVIPHFSDSRVGRLASTDIKNSSGGPKPEVFCDHHIGEILKCIHDVILPGRYL